MPLSFYLVSMFALAQTVPPAKPAKPRPIGVVLARANGVIARCRMDESVWENFPFIKGVEGNGIVVRSGAAHKGLTVVQRFVRNGYAPADFFKQAASDGRARGYAPVDWSSTDPVEMERIDLASSPRRAFRLYRHDRWMTRFAPKKGVWGSVFDIEPKKVQQGRDQYAACVEAVEKSGVLDGEIQVSLEQLEMVVGDKNAVLVGESVVLFGTVNAPSKPLSKYSTLDERKLKLLDPAKIRKGLRETVEVVVNVADATGIDLGLLLRSESAKMIVTVKEFTILSPIEKGRNPVIGSLVCELVELN